jgi:hypothetical protein
VAVHDTTYASERKVANVVIGLWKNGQTLVEKLFLLSYQEMSAVNYTKITHVFSEAEQTLWPDGMKFDVLLLVTYTTTYVDDKSSRSTFIQLS